MSNLTHLDDDIIELNLLNRLNDVIDELGIEEGEDLELNLAISVDATVDFADEDYVIAVEGYINANDEAHDDTFSVALRVRSYFKYRAKDLTDEERDKYADMALDKAKDIWGDMLSDLSDDTGTPLIELGPLEENTIEVSGPRLN